MPEIASNLNKKHDSFDSLQIWAAKHLGKDIRNDGEARQELALQTYITCLIEFETFEAREHFLSVNVSINEVQQKTENLRKNGGQPKNSQDFEILMKYRHLPLLWTQCNYKWIESHCQSPEISKIYGNPPIYLCVSSIIERYDINLIHQSFFELTGKGILIAVIDSGIDQSHPDLQNKVVDVINISEEEVGDYNGHGTYIASILLGNGAASNGFYHGIAPDARLIDVKLFNRDGSATVAELLIAFDLLMNRQGPELPSIINLSCVSGLMGITDGLIERYCRLLFDHGVIIVCPAGNFGPENNSIPSPGNSIYVFTVGSIDNHNNIAFFSGRGNGSDRKSAEFQKPDIVILGSEIIAARSLSNKIGKKVTDEPQYMMLSGTSISTAVASGMFALIKQTRLDLLPNQAFQILKEYTTKINSYPHSQGFGSPQLLETLTSNRLYSPKPLKFRDAVNYALKISLAFTFFLILLYYLV